VNLIDEGFDIAVRVGNPGDTSLITRRLCDMQGVIATSPDYPTRHSEPASPDQSR
jgi:DNA-binding transcriptional LysR family regulator